MSSSVVPAEVCLTGTSGYSSVTGGPCDPFAAPRRCSHPPARQVAWPRVPFITMTAIGALLAATPALAQSPTGGTVVAGSAGITQRSTRRRWRLTSKVATVNATNRAQNNPLGTRPPLLRRVDQRLYVRAAENSGSAARIQPQATPAQQGSRHGLAAHVVLIGCVRTKRAIACAAAELFASPLFDGRRRYAVASGVAVVDPECQVRLASSRGCDRPVRRVSR